jgi:hypothetical protein
LFQARIAGDEISQSNDTGFWLEDAGSISLVARNGDQAADLPTGVNYKLLAFPKMNSRGDIAMHGNLQGVGIDNTNNRAIWAGTPNLLQLIAQKGDPAPGTVGEVFTHVSLSALNDSGRLAISGTLPGTVFSGAPAQGIWAQDTAGELQLIVKSGDMLEVAPGDFREVWRLRFGGFNNRGQVVFSASFLGLGGEPYLATQGIFVSNLVAVPEPSSLGVAAICLTMCAATRRRRK